MPTGYSTIQGDAGKYIQDKLIALAVLSHKLPQMANPVPLENGMGKTANFTKFARTDVPVDQLVEGQTPNETAMTMTNQSVVVNQWGLFIALTDVGMVTTKHPVLNQALKLVADAIARTQDYGIAEVLNAGTNKQYWDGSRANRAAITSTDVFKTTVIRKALTGLEDAGAPPRQDGLFVAITGPQVTSDILTEATTVGGFVSAMQYSANPKALEDGAVGVWSGAQWRKSNFLPKFTLITTFTGIVAGAGGSLTGTVYYKFTRKSLARGFEEDIQAEGNTVLGANTAITFTAPATSGYVYNIYAGASTGDSHLFLVKENLAAGASYVWTTMPTSGTNPPATPNTGFTTYPIYVFADECLDWVEMNSLAMKGTITPPGPSDSDPLSQRRKVGAKYMAKAGIRDNTRTLVVELASAF